MFPLTHLYVNQIILGSMNPMQAIGSVLPDLLTSNGIPWQQAHSLKDKCSLPWEVYIADALHGVGLPGLDYYTDQSYRHGEGYAFYKARYIKDALTSLGVPEKDSLWRGHNIIEMAVEVNVRNTSRMTFEPLVALKSSPELLSGLEHSLTQTQGQSINLIKPISLFASLDGNQTSLAEHYSTKLNHVYQTDISGTSIHRLIDQAQSYIRKDYKYFLENCVARMENHLRVLERGASC
jgi:hypothetical protein